MISGRIDKLCISAGRISQIVNLPGRLCRFGISALLRSPRWSLHFEIGNFTRSSCRGFTEGGELLPHNLSRAYVSSSHLSYSHFYVGSMYGHIRLHVARSYTSSAFSSL